MVGRENIADSLTSCKSSVALVPEIQVRPATIFISFLLSEIVGPQQLSTYDGQQTTAEVFDPMDT